MSEAPAVEALEGRRLRLRPLASADAPALWEAVEASRAELRRRFSWGAAATSSSETAFIEESSRLSTRGEGLSWAVVEARKGQLAGVASLSGLGGERSVVRLSFWIRADRQARGYATEAGKALIEHAFRRLTIHRLHARIDPANRPGRKVLQKLGFRYEGCLRDHKRLNGRWIHQECWGLLKTEWKR